MHIAPAFPFHVCLLPKFRPIITIFQTLLASINRPWYYSHFTKTFEQKNETHLSVLSRCPGGCRHCCSKVCLRGKMSREKGEKDAAQAKVFVHRHDVRLFFPMSPSPILPQRSPYVCSHLPLWWHCLYMNDMDTLKRLIGNRSWSLKWHLHLSSDGSGRLYVSYLLQHCCWRRGQNWQRRHIPLTSMRQFPYWRDPYHFEQCVCLLVLDAAWTNETRSIT